MMLSEAELEALALSLQVSLTAVALALPVALLAALLLARRRVPFRGLIEGALSLPLVLPPVVIGYLFLMGFGTRGPIGGFLLGMFGISFAFHWTGAALVSAAITFPLQLRAIRLSLESIDTGLLDAAASLGASPLDRFRSVTLPLAMPGILAGAMTAFAASLGEFGAIITFVSNIPGQTRTLPLAIYSALEAPNGEAAAARLCALSIVLALLFVGLAEVARRRAEALLRP